MSQTKESPRIFLSYARSDGGPVARELRVRLSAEHRFSLWHDLADMEGGRDWWRQIVEAIERVEYLLLVMTPGALRSEVVHREWRLARHEGVCVVPLFGASELDFSSLPRWMQRAHFVDPRVPEQWNRLVHMLERPCSIPRVPLMIGDRADDFVRREHEFEQVRAALLEEQEPGVPPRVLALCGTGGYGKTALATALCHDAELQDVYSDGVLWVTLGREPGEPVGRVEDLVQALTGKRPGFASVQAASAYLAELLADRAVLVVVDDVWDSGHLRPFLEGGPRCARLVTTRNSAVVPPRAQRVRVDAMRPTEARQLLAQGLADQSRANMGRLVTRLGEWPLLLKLANGVLRERVNNAGQPLAAALEYLDKALDRRGLTAFDDNDAEDRGHAVANTLDVSLELLAPDERCRFAELSIFPEDIDVPLAAVEHLWRATAGFDDFDTETLCERLYRLSLLLELDLATRHLRLHDVVRSYLQSQQQDKLQALHSCFLDSHDVARWADLPHDEPYLWRFLGHHLAGAGRHAVLRALLTDYGWLAAKLRATDVHAVIADFSRLPSDETLGQVEAALRLAAHILARHGSALASQLVGRLAASREAEVVALLARIPQGHPGRWLRPLSATLRRPGGPLVQTLVGHERPVNAVCVLADGSRALSGSSDGTLRLWDLSSGAQLRKLPGHGVAVNAVAVARDDRIGVSGGDDGSLRVWDLDTGLELQRVDMGGGFVTAVALVADGSRVAAGCSTGRLVVWDLPSRERLYDAAVHAGRVSCVQFTDGDSLLLSAATDGALVLSDLRAATVLRRFEGHQGWVLDLALAGAGSRVVSASDDGSLIVWNLAEGTPLERFPVDAGGVNAVAVSPDGRWLVSGAEEGAVRAREWRPGGESKTFGGHDAGVYGVAISPDSRLVLSASGDRTVKVWNLEGRPESEPAPPHRDRVDALAISDDDTLAVSGSDDETLKVWDLDTLQPRHALHGHLGWVRCVAVFPGGRRAVSGSADKTLKVWDLEDGREIVTLEDEHGHEGSVNAVACLPDARRVVSGSSDQTLVVWDIERGEVLQRFEGHEGAVTAVAVDDAGSRIVSASADGTLRCWALGEREAVRVLRGRQGSLVAMWLAGDGQRALSASADGILSLWDLDSGETVKTVALPQHRGQALAVTPDGSKAVSASGVGGLKVGDLSRSAWIAGFTGESALTSCAVTSDGATILAGEQSGRVHFLRLV